MLNWSVQHAKAKFSELLDTCIEGQAQIVTKRGREVAVLVSIEEWKRLQAQAKPSLKQLLLADDARIDEVPTDKRNKKRRDIPTFD